MENRIDVSYDKETAFKTLEIVNSWILSADNKSAILIAFIALLVGVSSNSFSSVIEVIQSSDKLKIVLVLVFGVLYLIALCLVVYNLIEIFIARTIDKVESGKANLVSYVSISKLTLKQFYEISKNLSEDQLINMIKEQVFVNSIVAYKKMKYFNRALLFSIMLIPLTIVLMIVL